MTLATLGQPVEERDIAQEAAMEDIWFTAYSDVDENNIDMARVHACVAYRTAVIGRLSSLAYTTADVTAADRWPEEECPF